jgi:hypothetical protein
MDPERFSALACVGAAYRLLFARLGIWARLVLPYGALLVAADGLALALGSIDLMSTVNWIASFFILAAIAVNWHRFVLLGEPPRFLFGSIVARYAFVDLLIVVAFLGPVLLGGLLAASSSAGPILLLLLVCYIVFAAYAMNRIALILPAIAIADPRITLNESWRRMRPFVWRVFFGQIVLALPIVLFSIGLDWFLIRSLGTPDATSGEPLALPLSARFAWLAVQILYSAFGATLFAGYLSEIYSRLVEPPK